MPEEKHKRYRYWVCVLGPVDIAGLHPDAMIPVESAAYERFEKATGAQLRTIHSGWCVPESADLKAIVNNWGGSLGGGHGSE